MAKKKEMQTTFVDVPGLCETFADSINTILFDGQTLRIEFCVTRMDEPNPPNPVTGKKYPVCRLVMTANAGIAFYNRLHQLISSMEEAGAIKKGEPPKSTPPIIQ